MSLSMPRRRLVLEDNALAVLKASNSWLERLEWSSANDGAPTVEADIRIDDLVYEVQLVYPVFFPDVPAFILPRKAVRWSFHQYGVGGTLCLEWGPDNWHSGVTGAMLLESAYKLLATERPHATGEDDSQVQSRHTLTEGQRLRVHPCRLVMTEELQQQVAKLVHLDRLSISSRTAVSLGELIVVASPVPTEKDKPSSILYDIDFTWDRSGWVLVHNFFGEFPSLITTELLEPVLKTLSIWPFEDGALSSSVIILAAPGTQARAFTVSKGSVTELEPVVFNQATAPRQPAGFEALHEKSVAIVGLGSIGSKVAASLARAGVGQFILIDDDILAPHNLVRHDADLREVGHHKVTAVAKRINLISPDATVVKAEVRLAGQESPKAASGWLKILTMCDLIIDATASPEVFTLLGAACTRQKVPMIWGELFAGGFGGMMVRARPNIEASPLTVRNGLNQYFASLPDAPGLNATDYDATSDNKVQIAADADVSHMAALLSQFALDTLGVHGDSQYPYSAYLVGFRSGWFFECPFQTLPLEVASASDEPPAELDLDSDEPRVKAILASIIKNTNAGDNPDT
jgi:molybdopterin/thiamine biosynthesis adenylyltransferase